MISSLALPYPDTHAIFCIFGVQAGQAWDEEQLYNLNSNILWNFQGSPGSIYIDQTNKYHWGRENDEWPLENSKIEKPGSSFGLSYGLLESGEREYSQEEQVAIKICTIPVS